MSDEVRVVLPWGCLVPDNQRKGGMVGHVTTRYRAGKQAARMIAMSQIRGERPRFTEPVTLELLFWLPDERKRDTSNLIKLVKDALETVAYDDDNRVKSMATLDVGLDRDNPRVEITIMRGRYRPIWAKEE